jgi:carbonic anhydrase
MVHYADDGNVTVVSILYRYGKPDPFLFQVNRCDTLEGLYYIVTAL